MSVTSSGDLGGDLAGSSQGCSSASRFRRSSLAGGGSPVVVDTARHPVHHEHSVSISTRGSCGKVAPQPRGHQHASARDDKFRSALLDNPEETLRREFESVSPEGVRVEVHEETPEVIHLVVPGRIRRPHPRRGALMTSSSMMRVDRTGCCTCGASTSQTFSSLQSGCGCRQPRRPSSGLASTARGSGSRWWNARPGCGSPGQERRRPRRSTRLATWRQAVGRGDEAAFRRRLAAEAWQLDDVVAALRATAWPADLPLPSWGRRAEDVLAHPHEAADPPTGQTDRLCGDSHAVPPCRAEASARPVGDGSSSFFAPSAVDAIERLLLLRPPAWPGARLSLSSLASAPQPAPPGPAGARRERFGRDRRTTRSPAPVREGGLGEIFRHYPVLARLISRLTELWIASTAEPSIG